MRNKLAVAGLGILLVLAILGKSAVMAVSVLGMGLAFWWKRAAPLPKLLGAVVLGALLFSLFAEVVHTLYHRIGPPGVAGDEGGFFVSALLVGLINAAAFAALLLLLHWLLKPRAA